MSRAVGCSKVAPSIVAGRRSRCLHRSAWSRSPAGKPVFVRRESAPARDGAPPAPVAGALEPPPSPGPGVRRARCVSRSRGRRLPRHDPRKMSARSLPVAVGEIAPFPPLLTGCSRSSGLAFAVVLAAFVEVDAQRGRRWVDGSRWNGRAGWSAQRRLEVAQPLAQSRHRAVAAGGARLDRLLANPEQRAGTLLLVSHPLGGEGGV